MTLRERIISHEGIRLKPYHDSLGYLTIGVGRCLEGHGISKDEALYMLDNDIARVKRETVQAMPWLIGLDDIRQEVIYEMVFQLGINRTLLFKKMLNAVREGDYEKAAQEMISSVWRKQTPARCEELANIMKRGF
jgi:lysozyme